jgi:vacuolar-type H+-ATPase subunit F/Vma7
MRIRCIGDETLVAALRLAGITGRAVDNEEAARDALEDYAIEESVVLVGGGVYRWVRKTAERLLSENRDLSIVEIPDLKEGPLEVESDRQILEKVLGMRF